MEVGQSKGKSVSILRLAAVRPIKLPNFPRGHWEETGCCSPVSLDCSSIVLRLFFDCSSIVLRLFFDCSSIGARILRWCRPGRRGGSTWPLQGTDSPGRTMIRTKPTAPPNPASDAPLPADDALLLPDAGERASRLL